MSARLSNPRKRLLGALPKGGVGVEIGVWKGDFSAAILTISAPVKLHLIDPWKQVTTESHKDAWYAQQKQQEMDAIHEDVVRRFADEAEAGRVRIHRATSEEAMRDIGEGELDFVYIDGDHSYQGVKTDLDLSWRRVKVGGFIACDDYMDGNWWGDGVTRATNEFIGERASQIRIVMALGGQILLRRVG